MEDKRRPVYTEIEKTMLKELVIKYKHYIENKQTDSVSNKKKNEAWGKLTEEYNQCSLINQNATVKQLQALWKNLKHKERELLVAEKQYRHLTGEGSSKPDYQIDPLMIEASPFLLVEVPNVIYSDTLDIDNNLNITSEFTHADTLSTHVDNNLNITNESTHADNNSNVTSKSTHVDNNSNITSDNLSNELPVLENEETVVIVTESVGEKRSIDDEYHVQKKRHCNENIYSSKESIESNTARETFPAPVTHIMIPTYQSVRGRSVMRGQSSTRFSSRSPSPCKVNEDLKNHAIQTEASARLQRVRQLEKQDNETHALDLQIQGYKLEAERYRSQSERLRVETSEIEKEAAELRLKILQIEYAKLQQ